MYERKKAQERQKAVSGSAYKAMWVGGRENNTPPPHPTPLLLASLLMRSPQDLGRGKMDGKRMQNMNMLLKAPLQVRQDQLRQTELFPHKEKSYEVRE